MRLAASAALMLLLAVCACSSSSGGSSTPCNQDPWQCPSTQTCWPQSATAFACMNAGPGTVGSSCEDSVGTPTCGAGLFCLQQATTTPGTCLAYCSTSDPNHACTGGALCRAVALMGGPEFSLCVPTATGGDGGTGADGGGTADGGRDAPAGG